MAEVTIDSNLDKEITKYQRTRMKEITEEILLPTLNQDILILPGKGSPRVRLRDDQYFKIYIWGAPDDGYYGAPVVTHPRTIFGVEIEFYLWSHSLRESHAEGQYLVMDSDTVVATVLPNHLFIHHDIFDLSRNIREWPGLEIYRRIIEEVAKFMNTTVDVSFQQIAEKILGPALPDTRVIVSAPHGKCVRSLPDKPDTFSVLIWTTLSRDRESLKAISAQKTIWDIPVDCSSWTFSPSGNGTAIKDGDYVVAELFEHSVFIHHDVCHYNTENEHRIFQKILEEVIKALPNLKERVQEEKEEQRANELAKKRTQYIEACSSRFNKVIIDLKDHIKTSRDKIAKLQKDLITELRILEEDEIRLIAYEGRDGALTELFGREFEKLMSLEKVLDVEIRNTTVRIYTDTLYCVNPITECLHEIGKFRIEIYADGGKGGIKLYNLTSRVSDGYHAPHVDCSGDPCLGNLKEVLPSLIANYEYSVIAMLAIQFIESVNMDGVYVSITNWPIAKRRTTNEAHISEV